jgi:hypothetical protein
MNRKKFEDKVTYSKRMINPSVLTPKPVDIAALAPVHVAVTK